MGWRRKTVKGFEQTFVAWAAAIVLAAFAVDGWWDGDPARVAAGWTAGAVIAVVAGVWAFRDDAARAFGPPGSPERRRRRLTDAQLARDLGGGLLVGAALAVLLRFVSDDPPPSIAYQILYVLVIGLLYGAAFAWRQWTALDDEDTAPETEAIPARSVPRPAAAPPRDRGIDVRRGAVVCVLLAVLGLLAAVEGVVDGDGQRAGLGLGLLIASAGLLVWLASRWRGHL